LGCLLLIEVVALRSTLGLKLDHVLFVALTLFIALLFAAFHLTTLAFLTLALLAFALFTLLLTALSLLFVLLCESCRSHDEGSHHCH